MLIIRKSKKPLIITLSVILGIAVIFAAFLGIYYIRANALVYYYVDVRSAFVNGVDYPPIENDEDYPRRYPFFGNPLTISEEEGAATSFPLGAGQRYFHVYCALNDPIKTWIAYLEMRYINNARVDYTVDMDDEYIRVYFTGTLTENGEVTPIEQTFAFNLKNVSLYAPPSWENSDEISEGYKEFLIYCHKRYPDEVKTPDWILENSND